LRASFTNIARAAGTTTTIDIRFGAVLDRIGARRRCLTHHAHRIARVARAVAILVANATNIAFVAFGATAIDIGFVLILDAIAARGRAPIGTRDRCHAIVADLTVGAAIEQRYPLPAILRIRSAALNRIAATL
jgi:hypothetical protein